MVVCVPLSRAIFFRTGFCEFFLGNNRKKIIIKKFELEPKKKNIMSLIFSIAEVKVHVFDKIQVNYFFVPSIICSAQRF